MSELIKDTAAVANSNDPYGDINKLIANQNSLLEQQQAQQNQMLDKQLQMQVDQINRNKAEIDENTNKTTGGLYTEYKKASNKYGPNAENLYTQGLGNSGFAESTQTSLYNQYQKNITDTLNTAQKLKSDFDFQIQQAMQNRDLQAAQFALELYKQKMNLATQEYDLKNNKEQDLYNRSIDERNYNYQLGRDQVADNQWNQTFNYNKERDTVSDAQWQKQYEQALKEYENAQKWKQIEYDYQKSRDSVSDNQWQQTFNYQKSRDSIADDQWAKEFALTQAQASKASSGGSSRSSGGSRSSGSSSSSGSYTVNQSSAPDISYDSLSEAGKNFVNGFNSLAALPAGQKANFLRDSLSKSNLSNSDIYIITHLLA